jgi:hypothetical protein
MAQEKEQFVSDDLARILDHIAGIPDGKLQRASTIQAEAHGSGGITARPMVGQWVGGCYYVMDEAGPVHTKRGNWRLVACVA